MNYRALRLRDASERDLALRDGFTLIELMIVIAIIAIIAAIAIPGILSATRASNERNASGSLKTMGTAEMTFRSTDADQNGITDFWTADIAGLHWVSTAATAAPYTNLGFAGIIPRMGVGGIQLLEISLAMADANTIEAYDGNGAIVFTAQPKAGYWYQVLTDFESGPAVVNVYGNRHGDRFGFIAWPNAYPSGGKQVFILSEANTQFRKDPASEAAFLTSGKPTPGVAADTAAVLDTLYNTFPVNPTGAATSEAAGAWAKMD